MGFYKKGLYRKKPVIIEAEQLAETIEIETLEGIMIGRDGDWLITGVAVAPVEVQE